MRPNVTRCYLPVNPSSSCPAPLTLLCPGLLHHRHTGIFFLLEHAVPIPLYLVSPLLIMLCPEGEAASLLSLKCDLLREAYLPWLPLLRMTIQSRCYGPLCGWHLSQSVISQLRGPNGPANSVCPGSWHSDPLVSAVPYIDASLFRHLVKAENLTDLCAWVVL